MPSGLFFYPLLIHWTSCSGLRKTGVSKNSIVSIFSPSQTFLMVEIVGLLITPLTILFRVDCVTPDTVASLFSVIPLSLHSVSIQSATAFPQFMLHSLYTVNSGRMIAMAGHKKMYFCLAAKVADAAEILIRAQQQGEWDYMEEKKPVMELADVNRRQDQKG